MSQFRPRENVDRRVLGAFRFVNEVDQSPILNPLTIRARRRAASQAPFTNEASPLRVARNRVGLYIISAAIGFEDYINSFDPPDLPPLASLIARLRVEDPSGEYFPIDLDLPLPRSTQPGDPLNPVVFDQRVVSLLPSPTAPAAGGWSVWRLVIWRDSDASVPPHQRAVPIALVRLLSTTQTDAAGNPLVLGRGLTEWRPRITGERPTSAEAQVSAPGVPITNWNLQPGGAVITTGLDVVLQVRFDAQFDPTQPNALPDLARLDPPPGTALPAGVFSGQLNLHLEARERRSLHAVFNFAGNTLRQIAPRDLNI